MFGWWRTHPTTQRFDALGDLAHRCDDFVDRLACAEVVRPHAGCEAALAGAGDDRSPRPAVRGVSLFPPLPRSFRHLAQRGRSTRARVFSPYPANGPSDDLAKTFLGSRRLDTDDVVSCVRGSARCRTLLIAGSWYWSGGPAFTAAARGPQYRGRWSNDRDCLPDRGSTSSMMRHPHIGALFEAP